ncbi:NtaA/DmoA family FMN-dependent monooxygenase [Arthrobacter sp. I2-34]|uniref:NtaA/DmoA family FMN-dependent monooxygenase n=1 Tax=Arthrobacter hankyongi TaxID=2904801 RepID=A0ABS9L3I2_9MICC|nr:NtaA/DmoA family FMN-dependent monooxygenase [Arthrobacter hankyongi]MCG2621241.1 NtaA/DmoA family FMN-dependent monooxygenase [Arthrobacter hankyongi]
MTRQMHLTVQLISGYGLEPAAWRWPGIDPASFINADVFVKAAQTAERGRFDALFLADTPVLSTDVATAPPQQALEPIVTLTAVARETERIGLVATSSTTLNHPFTVARQFRALDLVSQGRAGWNAVTTSHPGALLNYGTGVPSRGERYERAHEFIAAVMALWGSWEDDALIMDKEAGRFADASRVTPVGLAGRHVASRGPLGLPPSEQGQPVVFQAGGGLNGLRLAGRFANAVYNNPFDIPSGVEHAAAVAQAASTYGRSPDHMTVFNGIITSVASTRKEALERREQLDALGDLETKVAYLGQQIGVPLSIEDIDKPVHQSLLENARANPADPRSPLALELAGEGLTVRRILAHGTMNYHPVALGTPDEVADILQRWHEAGVGKGFNINPDATDGLEHFVDEVIPILQERGLFRREYAGTTLRDHLGIPRQNGLPAGYGQHVGAAS